MIKYLRVFGCQINNHGEDFKNQQLEFIQWFGFQVYFHIDRKFIEDDDLRDEISNKFWEGIVNSKFIDEGEAYWEFSREVQVK